MKLSVKELLEATKGQLVKGSDPLGKFFVSTDTRSITVEDIFLPLKGPNFDGHDYIDTALDKGCRGYFIDNCHSPSEKPADFVIAVDDTLTAYLRIANYARRKVNPKVVAITGSSGKTTTKEFISAVLEMSFVTHKSALNYNNEIGLCKTLLSMPENTQYLVLEMGMRGLGEIELLSKYSEPDIAVITNIGTAHIGRLGTVENIAIAKCEIVSHLYKDGLLIAPDNELIEKYCNYSGKKVLIGHEYEIVTQEENRTEFIYKGEYYVVPTVGKYNITNSIFAIETGLYSGISINKIKNGLLNYVPVCERGKVISLDNNIKLIADCYNANPESVIAAIDCVVETYKNLEIVLLLGDMAELGDHEEYYHRKIGHYVSEKPIKLLITVGEKAKLVAESVRNNVNTMSFFENKKAADFLKNNLEKNTVVLLKASRCMKLEEIIEYLNC